MFINQITEAISGGCSVKKVFLKISQHSQRNTCVGVSASEIRIIAAKTENLPRDTWQKLTAHLS